MGVVGGGGQAEFLPVHERQLMPVPDSLSWEQAGGFPEAFITAHDALRTQGGLSPGDRVLVSGAAGGVGVAGVQIAAAAGAEVIASVRNPVHREALVGLGAARAIDPAEAEADGPYDVILEIVGAVNFESNLRSLNLWGRMLIIGAVAGTEAKLDFMQSSSPSAPPFAAAPCARVLWRRRRPRPALLSGRYFPSSRAGRSPCRSRRRIPSTKRARPTRRSATPGKLGKIVLIP